MMDSPFEPVVLEIRAVKREPTTVVGFAVTPRAAAPRPASQSS